MSTVECSDHDFSEAVRIQTAMVCHSHNSIAIQIFGDRTQMNCITFLMGQFHLIDLGDISRRWCLNRCKFCMGNQANTSVNACKCDFGAWPQLLSIEHKEKNYSSVCPFHRVRNESRQSSRCSSVVGVIGAPCRTESNRRADRTRSQCRRHCCLHGLRRVLIRAFVCPSSAVANVLGDCLLYTSPSPRD